MFATLQQQKAHAGLKAALIEVLLAHQDPDQPETFADAVTAGIQCTEDGLVGTFELTADDRGHDIPCGGGSL